MKVLVTGGAGFIGSALVRMLIRETEYEVLNLDCLTYAGSLETVREVAEDPRYTFARADIRNLAALRDIFAWYRPDIVVHLAAESHVDRSIRAPAAFVETNLVGTFNVLEAALVYWQGQPAARRSRFRFHHVSTDEVYGSLGDAGRFSEASPYRPNSPYAASKAGADHLVRAWNRTYGLPALISNCSNNYGPFQHPEKLIPRVLLSALEGKPLPVYGQGLNVRDWLYVDDHARALKAVFERGRPGEQYNIGGNHEKRNIDVVRAVCRLLDEMRPRSNGRPYEELISFVEDRSGHDWRYAIDAQKSERELGWRPGEAFEEGLRRTVAWYLTHLDWCARVLGKSSSSIVQALAGDAA